MNVNPSNLIVLLKIQEETNEVINFVKSMRLLGLALVLYYIKLSHENGY